MYRNLIHCFLLTVMMTVVSLTAVGAADNVYALNKLSTDSLTKLGQEKVNKGEYEEALVCFTIAAKRYSPDLDKEEKYYVMAADIGKWYVYFFEYYDHVNAFKALSEAQEISREIGQSDFRIMLNYGCMYQTLSEQSDDPELLEKALDCYTESIRIGLEKDQDLSWVNMAFSNLVQVCATLDKTDILGPYWDKFLKRNAELKTATPSFSFDSLFYGVVLKMHDKDFTGAIADLDGARMKGIVSQEGMGRYDIVRLINLAKAYIGLSGGYSRAIDCLRKAEVVADSVGMKDARLEVYRYMRDVYNDAGQKDKSLEYQHKYLALKDSILNYRSGAAISELTYLKKIENVEKNLDSIDRKRALQAKIIWIAVALILIAAVSLWFLRRHNRKLKILNETLYRNNILLIQKEETTRRQLEDSMREKAISPEISEKKSPKYNRSDLTEEEKDDIYMSVMNVMLNTSEVFEPDFSSARLSELTGNTYRHISQVINERTGDNFNALVNDTRVKEACRNMQPGGKFSNLTVEAIGNSVGFRSRTSFISAFKKFTGMTPSGYMKIAAEKAKEKTINNQ